MLNKYFLIKGCFSCCKAMLFRIKKIVLRQISLYIVSISNIFHIFPMNNDGILHMDEKTPHIHATIVPIVTGERRKAQKEEQNGKKKYRKKNTQDVRLCADDVMARHKQKHYQDTYAQAMGKYGLQRGIDGSLAKHISTMQYYKELIEQQDSLQENIETLLGLEEESQKRLKQV